MRPSSSSSEIASARISRSERSLKFLAMTTPPEKLPGYLALEHHDCINLDRNDDSCLSIHTTTLRDLGPGRYTRARAAQPQRPEHREIRGGPTEPEPFDAAPPDTLPNALGKRLDNLESAAALCKLGTISAEFIR